MRDGALDRRLLLVTGKGGVGRSALTAALTLAAARRGKRVLAIAMAAESGLTQHLGVAELGYRPIETRPGVWGARVDPAASLDEYLRLQLRVPRLGPLIGGFRLLADTVPGIRDTVVIGKVVYEAMRRDWDLVVADGPPTGQIHSYLAAPATIETLVPSGRVRNQAEWMRSSLADPESTGLVLVGLAEELPVSEMQQTLESLDQDPLADVAAIVINRVLTPLEVEFDAEPPGPRRDAALHHAGLVEAQSEWRAMLPSHVALPYLFDTRTPAEVAMHLADHLEAT